MQSEAVVGPPAGIGRGGKYLTFALGKEEYGLEILRSEERRVG